MQGITDSKGGILHYIYEGNRCRLNYVLELTSTYLAFRKGQRVLNKPV